MLRRSLIISVMLVCLFAVMIAQAAEDKSSTAWLKLDKSQFGIGFGLPYGGIGVKYETAIMAKNFTLTAAPGLTGSNAGVKYYLPAGEKSKSRTFLSARYGIMLTKVDDFGSGSDSTKTFAGFCIGAGVRGRHWEAEAGYAPKPSSWTATDELETGSSWMPLRLGVGYNF